MSTRLAVVIISQYKQISKTLCYIPETNIMSYVNYASIKKSYSMEQYKGCFEHQQER